MWKQHGNSLGQSCTSYQQVRPLRWTVSASQLAPGNLFKSLSTFCFLNASFLLPSSQCLRPPKSLVWFFILFTSHNQTIIFIILHMICTYLSTLKCQALFETNGVREINKKKAEKFLWTDSPEALRGVYECRKDYIKESISWGTSHIWCPPFPFPQSVEAMWSDLPHLQRLSPSN